MKKLLLATTLTLAFCQSALAAPLTKIAMCVFDPIGKSGPAAQVMRDFKLDSVSWGVEIVDEFFDNEWKAIEKYKSGGCDIVNMLGFRAYEFNTFTGSIHAVGALRNYDEMAVVIKTMSSEGAAKVMRNGDTEVIAIMPAGGVFVFTRDRTLIQPDQIKGKKFAVVEKMPEAEFLAKKYGYTNVPMDIFATFQAFNKGEVDLVAGPAVVYEPFELSKGLAQNGGIYKDPVAFITMQTLARWEKLPEGFAQKSRNRSVEKYTSYLKLVQDPEKTVPENLWITVPKDVYDYWDNSFRESRGELAKQGLFDARTLKLMKKTRCKTDPKRAECSDASNDN